MGPLVVAAVVFLCILCGFVEKSPKIEQIPTEENEMEVRDKCYKTFFGVKRNSCKHLQPSLIFESLLWCSMEQRICMCVKIKFMEDSSVKVYRTYLKTKLI